MKKSILKKITAAALTLALCASYAMPAFPAENMSKGLLGYDSTMLPDASELCTDEIVFNLTTTFWQNNRNGVKAYLGMAAYYGIDVTLILINDYQTANPSLMPADADLSNYYFMFNVFDDAGKATSQSYITSVATTLGPYVDRYIIGNEIQDQLWNYIGPMDAESYCAKYAECFTTAYECIQAADPGAEVYIPFDYGWNNEGNGTTKYNGRTCLDYLSTMLPKEMDWGVAWHAYPDPLTSPVFWDDTSYAADNADAYIVNFANLHVLTDYLQQEAFLRSDGTVRNIILSEQGFTSLSGGVTDEELQAAAYAAGYFIAKANPYIKAYMLNRQVDAPGEVAADHAFGIWNASSDGSPSSKKYLWQVFKDIDDESANQYIKDLVYAKTGMSF